MLKTAQVHKTPNNQPTKQKSKSKRNIQQQSKGQRITVASFKSNTLSLISKPPKTNLNKQNVPDEINEQQDAKQKSSFALGHRLSGHRNMNLKMDKISEGQGCCSGRGIGYYKSARQHLLNNYNQKENYNISTACNVEDGLKQSVKSKSNTRKSKQSTKNKNQKSKSTNASSRVKNSNKMIELRTEKVQKSVKMLWQCIGELWQSSRVCQYRSEKSNQNIVTLRRKLEEQEQKILQMKYQISQIQKGSNKAHLGLRA